MSKGEVNSGELHFPIFLGAYNLLLSNVWNNVWRLEATGTNYIYNTKFGNIKVHTAIHTYQNILWFFYFKTRPGQQ